MVNNRRLNNEELTNSTQSYWTDSIKLLKFPKLEQDLHVDTVIVGGGITGITAAYILAKQGVKVAILEADRLLNGTTGHTTAKVTAQHGLIYDELIKNMGKTKASMYYKANREALHFIKNTIESYQIDCDFSQQDACIYATTEEYEKKIEKEAIAYQKLGIDGRIVNSIPFNIEVKSALIMKDQAQFHPLKYLKVLIEQITNKGGEIFEITTAVDLKTKDHATVFTRDGNQVTADHVLSCTHFPFHEGLGLYSARMYAERAYLIAAKTKEKFPGGMYISADEPTRLLRSVLINDEEMVLIGGEKHKTGQDTDTPKHYRALENFGKQTLGLETIAYKWSAQDLTTIDKVPYVGRVTSGQDKVLIATGYRKWGMSNGTASALLLADIVIGKKNEYEDLYTPARFYPKPSLKNLVVENLDVAKHLIKGKLETSSIDPNAISNDQGAIISVKGERKGAYKDKEGKLHVVDTTCTHIGCEVNWNNSERTWDCPCHGSRFSYTGEVIEGPAEKPLQKYDYKMLDNLTSDDSGY